ncbi:MAG: VCBS repeat-containing protein [Verrucomicrobiae bacterium]|nr:VCBS repeat-containing protein [Verrucomicrobiae bacterium]
MWAIIAGFLLTGLFNALAADDLEWRAEAGVRWAALPVPGAGRAGFHLMPPAETGLQFTNTLDELRGASNRVLYNGAGLAAGDVDGDGWTDLFLCDLGGTNRLFRNRGAWRFDDVTVASGLGEVIPETRGAVFADINGDGHPDLLISVNGRGVRCFMNDGRGRFQDTTAAAGTAGPWGSTTMALADVNGDGSLDLYVANYRTDDIRDRGQVRIRMVQGRPVMAGAETNRFVFLDGRLEECGQPDRLLLNDGSGRFREVPWTSGAFLDEAGRPLTEPPPDWGLAAAFRDVNGDGAPDLYVCNDYWTPDRLWINDGRGGFRAAPPEALRHQSASSMSVDFADVDRDGLVDFFVVDMLSRDPRLRRRQKPAQNPPLAGIGEPLDRPQFVHNTLFLNRGDGTFAEVAHAAGLQATDWSWAPLFLDVDLDGYEDLLVGAGHFRDVQDLDAEAQVQARQHSWDGYPDAAARQRAFTRELMEHYRLYPLLRMHIGAFRNRGDVTFEERTADWGLDLPGVHQGLIAADFDNDGDLDLAVNSLNGPALLLRNESRAPRIAVRLKGMPPNTRGIGARITLRDDALPSQTTEVVAGGRYLSGGDTQVVFACGPASSRRTLEVVWRDGTRSVVTPVGINRLYEIPATGAEPVAVPPPEVAPALFEDVSASLAHLHPELPFDDFARQPLLPHRLSHLGPGVAWLDVNGDGNEDLVVGAGRGGVPAFFLGDGRGGFASVAAPLAVPDDTAGLVGWRYGGADRVLMALTGYEEARVPAVLGFEWTAGALALSPPAVPQPAPAGALAIGDPRGDGRLALFVAGGVAPGAYPAGAPSRLYWREGARWVPDADNSARLAAVGLVNAALWSDLDGDGRAELVLACEWGPLRVFRLTGTVLNEITDDLGLAGHTGLWRGVAAGDFNGDGLLDLVAANWGLNSPRRASASRPLVLAHGALAQPGVTDLLEAEWVGDQLAPRRQLASLAAAMPFLSDRFPTHRASSEASLDTFLGDRVRDVRRDRVTTLESMLFLNTGGPFRAVPLPREAQWAPAFGVVVADFDGDGNEDAFLSQNLFGTEAEMSRLDAGTGLLLRGDGQGGLTAWAPSASGIRIWGEGRGAATADFDGDGRPDLVVTQNGAATRLFRNRGALPGLRVRLQGPPGNPSAVGAMLRLKSGDRLGAARELHAGSGHWSQDSTTVVMGPVAAGGELWVRWPGGRITTTRVPSGAVEIGVSTTGEVVAGR